MTTTAVRSEDGAHFILNGVKQWATNGPIADLLVVMARTPAPVDAASNGHKRPRITAFIVEADTPGIEVTHRCDFLGLRGIQNGIITFRDVRVPAENIIWGEGLGLKMALKTLNTGRLTLPAACTGLARQCLRICREWGNEREQWGYPIGRHEAGREKIARIAALTFAIDAVTRLTSHWADEQRDIRIEAAMAKLFCSEAAWEIVDTTLQFRAGRGYERARSLRERGETPYPVERMLRDARINTIIEGTSDIMRLFLAREALNPHLKLAAALLKRGAPARAKAAAAAGMLRFYGAWYPVQVAGTRIGAIRSVKGAGRLARHHRFIDRTAHRLAAALFHAMAANGPKLEKRQVLLGALMEVGTLLFAMSAACACAASLDGEQRADAVRLADVFCVEARARIHEHFCRARVGRRAANALADEVLSGRLDWMEEGIITP